MTDKELKELVKRSIEQSYANPNTRKQYTMGVARLINRVPLELWNDEGVMMVYRQLLSPPVRSLFGVIWKKLHSILEENGIPCVHPDRLIYRMRRPLLTVGPLEDLSIHTSTAMVSMASWGDVFVQDGLLSFRGIPMDSMGERAIEALHEYFWPGEMPPPLAPLFPLSKKTRMEFLPEEMVEDAINDYRGEKSLIDDKIAYALYEAMYQNGYSLEKIDGFLESIGNTANFKRTVRSNARATLDGAVKLLSRYKSQDAFERMWEMGLRGESMMVQDALRLATPPPPKAPSGVTGNANWSMRVNVASESGVG